MLPPERPLPPLIKRLLRVRPFRRLSTVTASASWLGYLPSSCFTPLSACCWPPLSRPNPLLDSTCVTSPLPTSSRRYFGRRPARGGGGVGRMDLWFSNSGSMAGGGGGSSLSARRKVVLLLVLQSNHPFRARALPLASIDLDRGVRGLGSIVCLSAAVGIGIGGLIAYRLFKRFQQREADQAAAARDCQDDLQLVFVDEEKRRSVESPDCCACRCADSSRTCDAAELAESLKPAAAPALPNGMGNTQQHQRRRANNRRQNDAMEMRQLASSPSSAGGHHPETRRLLDSLDPDADGGSELGGLAENNNEFLLESAEEALPDCGAAAAADAAPSLNMTIQTDSLRAVSSLESVNRDSWPNSNYAAASPLRQSPTLPGYVTEQNQDLFQRVLHIYARVHSGGDSSPACPVVAADKDLPSLEADTEFPDSSLGAEFARKREEINGSRKSRSSAAPAAAADDDDLDDVQLDKDYRNQDEDELEGDEEDEELNRQQLLSSLRQGESLFSDCAASSSTTAVASSGSAWPMEDSGVDFASASVDPSSAATAAAVASSPPSSSATLAMLDRLLDAAAALSADAADQLAACDRLAAGGRQVADSVANVERQLGEARAAWEEAHSAHLLASCRLSHSSSFGLDLDLSSGDWSLYDEALQGRIGEIFRKAGLTSSPLALEYRSILASESPEASTAADAFEAPFEPQSAPAVQQKRGLPIGQLERLSDYAKSVADSPELLRRLLSLCNGSGGFVRRVVGTDSCGSWSKRRCALHRAALFAFCLSCRRLPADCQHWLLEADAAFARHAWLSDAWPFRPVDQHRPSAAAAVDSAAASDEPPSSSLSPLIDETAAELRWTAAQQPGTPLSRVRASLRSLHTRLASIRAEPGSLFREWETLQTFNGSRGDADLLEAAAALTLIRADKRQPEASQELLQSRLLSPTAPEADDLQLLADSLGVKICLLTVPEASAAERLDEMLPCRCFDPLEPAASKSASSPPQLTLIAEPSNGCYAVLIS